MQAHLGVGWLVAAAVLGGCTGGAPWQNVPVGTAGGNASEAGRGPSRSGAPGVGSDAHESDNSHMEETSPDATAQSESIDAPSRAHGAPQSPPPSDARPRGDAHGESRDEEAIGNDVGGENFGGLGGAHREKSAEKKSAPSPSSRALEPARRPEHRPGLATQFGEQRFSRVTNSPFSRADSSQPFAIGKLFYNDPQGIAAMSGGHGQQLHRVAFPVQAGHVEIGLRDGRGRFLSGFTANGDNFVTGIKGERYTIIVKNKGPGRIEAVVSVDGLDVIDGRPASLQKRGYLIEPHDELEIDGFRTDNDNVAAFRFGSVASSYANKKHGDTRNVGVIGAAIFHERGDSPSRWPLPLDGREAHRRHDAEPFPNRFASPP
ncbi:MAG: hypothetical protein EXR75_08900 [Myxococcales bacterium]|nr:hypothetical protein [Myxococcales bacterium]